MQASRALGASGPRLLFTRIMPNALTPLIVRGTLGIAGRHPGRGCAVLPGTGR